MTSHQFGFREGPSASHQVYRLVKRITTAKNNKFHSWCTPGHWEKLLIEYEFMH